MDTCSLYIEGIPIHRLYVSPLNFKFLGLDPHVGKCDFGDVGDVGSRSVGGTESKLSTGESVGEAVKGADETMIAGELCPSGMLIIGVVVVIAGGLLGVGV